MTFQLSNSLNLAELLVNPLTNSISQKTFTNIFPSIRVITACTAQKMKFRIKDFFSKCDQIRSAADLVTFTEEIFNAKLHFLCSASSDNSDRGKNIGKCFLGDTIRKRIYQQLCKIQ